MRLIFKILLLTSLFLGACQKKNEEVSIQEPVGPITPSYGDAIVVGSIADALNLVPIIASDGASHEICGLIFNGLVKYDKNLNLTGDLAESWEILDDGLTIIFHLRKDVKWHDGVPFTADDVQFTFKKLTDPQVRTPYSGDFERVKSLEVLDKYTVRVKYSEPFAPALESWGMSIIPKHLLEKEDLNATEFSRNPIGTGPYRFFLWDTAEKIELVANNSYFGKRPYIDRYIYRVIPNAASMFLELRAGGIDQMGLNPFQYTKQTGTKFFKENFNKFRYPAFTYTYLGYNLSNPLFSDIRVRKAINLAIDKQEIIDGVLYGLGRQITGPFIPGSWAYNEDVQPSAFDPEKAKELLKDAGWVYKNGVLRKDGMPFRFTLITNQGNEPRRMASEIIQRRLKAIGMDVRINIIEWKSLINEFIGKRKFDAVLLGWSLSRDPDLYDIWHSSKTKEGEFNFVGYKNPEVDRLIEEGRATFDKEKRKQIYHRVHKILYDEQPYCFLFNPDSLPIVHKRFHNIEVAPAGIGHNFIYWYVPKKLQRYRGFER
ncbi:peptide-binding protein [bacterium Unc6]|nr:peptide-binding protein [bacterium Unc6]